MEERRYIKLECDRDGFESRPYSTDIHFRNFIFGLLILDYNSETVVVVGIKCSNGNSFPKSIMLDKSTILEL